MKCIDSKFEIAVCGCKFLVRPDDNNVLCVEFGKDCTNPEHNPNIESSCDCKFTGGKDQGGYMIEHGKNCKDPFHKPDEDLK